MWSWPTQFPILKALTSTAGVGEGIRPASSSASDWQLAKESLGDGGGVGRNLFSPVCCLFALRLIAGKTP